MITATTTIALSLILSIRHTVIFTIRFLRKLLETMKNDHPSQNWKKVTQGQAFYIFA